MFFHALMPILATRTVMLVLAQENETQIRVTVTPKLNDKTENKALATPLTHVGTPEEFDAGFLGLLTEYAGAHAALRSTLDEAKALMAAAAAEAKAKAAAPKKGAAATVAKPATTATAAGKGATTAPKAAAPAPAPVVPNELELFGSTFGGGESASALAATAPTTGAADAGTGDAGTGDADEDAAAGGEGEDAATTDGATAGDSAAAATPVDDGEGAGDDPAEDGADDGADDGDDDGAPDVPDASGRIPALAAAGALDDDAFTTTFAG